MNQIRHIYEISHNIKYDIIIRLRPDIYILDEHIDFENYINEHNIIYALNDEFIIENNTSMNIMCDLFLNFDNIIGETDIFYNYVNGVNIKIMELNINYKLILTLCNIIAISGDSGSGKTTLMTELNSLFCESLLQIECDRYHKWERGDENWKKYTHLNPEANHISKFKNDIFSLKIGNNIYQVDYDHTTGKFTKPQEIKNKNNIILCGLHTLFDVNVNKLYDLKIYLDTDIKLRYYWKINRDLNDRGYNKDDIIKNIKRREEDECKYIKPQSLHSDIIISFFTDDDFDYTNNITPNIYLKLIIVKKYDMIEFIELLNISNINVKIIYNNDSDNDNDNNNILTFIFDKISDKFLEIYYKLLNKKINITLNKTEILSYYTIIKSLIIYLKY